MRQLGITFKTRLSLLTALFTCAVVVLAAPPAQADTITTVAGGGGTLGDGGPAASGRLSSPMAVAVTPDGGYVISDSGNGRVRKVSPGGTITTLASGLGSLWGIDALPDGSVLVVDGNRVKKISPGGSVSTVAGTGASGYGDTDGDGEPDGGDGGLATAATLWSPTAVSAIPGGGFLIADNDNNRVRKVDAGGTITTVAGNGTIGWGGDGGLATSASLVAPRALEATADGGFLIGGEDGRIRKVDAFGIINTVAGGGTDTTPDGGPATSAELDALGGIEQEAGGGFVFAENFGWRASRVKPNGVFQVVAGNGNLGFSGDGGDPRSAELAHAMDVAILPDGYLIVDGGNDRIRKVTLTDDADGDGIYDVHDNCLTQSNEDQGDLDNDGEGNACDPDIDGDGTTNGDDAFPENPSESADSDGDGLGDNGDNCPGAANVDQADQDDDGVGDVCDSDVDGDGAANTADNCPTQSNSDQADLDEDGVGDVCDSDVDGDGAANTADNCLTESNSDQADLDGDGRGDVCDSDIDGDGVDNADDWAPRDQSESKDTDGDGVGDNTDNCPVDANAAQADLDLDRTGDECDPDIDGDNSPNADDKFPYDPAESEDSDGDGVGDNGDRFPHDANESGDADDDGVGDRGDNCPTLANADQADADEDGTGDACDSTQRPTAGTICNLLTNYVTGSVKFSTLSLNKQAALQESLGNICSSIEKISTRLSAQQRAVLVRLQQLAVKSLAQDWLTADQAAKVQRLIGNM